MDEPIVIKLTVEHMQYQILQAIHPREAELRERIEQAVNQAIASFDFQAEIQRNVASTLRRHMQLRTEHAVLLALEKAKSSQLDEMIQAEVQRQLRGK